MEHHRQAAVFVIVLLGAIVPFHASADVYPRLTRSSFESASGSKGVVLLAVRWDRWWGCAGYDNAQLTVIGFDKLPSAKSDQDPPDILLDDAPRLMTKPIFDNYGLLVDPGEYGLSGFLVRVAKSVSSTEYYGAQRSEIIKDGRSSGGSFVVAADEIVYIGNFYLDCYQIPTIWRYYTEDRATFNKHMAEFKREFPFLDITKAVYRLFETELAGNHYELP
jgi:hypothetical protein